MINKHLQYQIQKQIPSFQGWVEVESWGLRLRLVSELAQHSRARILHIYRQALASLPITESVGRPPYSLGPTSDLSGSHNGMDVLC